MEQKRTTGEDEKRRYSREGMGKRGLVEKVLRGGGEKRKGEEEKEKLRCSEKQKVIGGGE